MKRRIHFPTDVRWKAHPPANADAISRAVLDAIRSATMGFLGGDSIEIVTRDDLEMPVLSGAGEGGRHSEERMEEVGSGGKAEE